MRHLIIITILLALANSLMSQESLKIVWLEQYQWKLLSNQEDEKLHIINIIPGKEEAETWTMLGQMMSIKNALNISMEKAKNLMFEQSKINSPEAKLTFLEKNEETEYPWILFKIENPYFNNDKNPESQLWYIRQGKTALFVNFIAIKEKELKDEVVTEWSKVFKASEVVVLKTDKEKKN